MPLNTTPPLLEVINVNKTFTRRGGWFGGPAKVTHAVRDASFSVQPGEVLAIVGESGSGKSTLARMLLGISTPDSGEIRFQGHALGTLSRTAISPVFQDPNASLNPKHRVDKLVGLPLVMNNTPRGDRSQRVTDMLIRVGLHPDMASRYPHQLSGGQRQRVAIARALIAGPVMLVSDEPTSALDVSVQAQVLKLLAELQQEQQLTHIIITHNFDVVRALADRVVVMYQGQILEQGSTRTLLQQPQHPYTQRLLSSVLTLKPGARLPQEQADA